MRTIVSDARRGHPGLYWFAVSMAALAVVLVVLSILDRRVLLGQPLWFKPLKFAISFTAYAGALAWMLGRLPAPGMRRTGWVLVAASTVEMAVIAGQAARGQRSHFNDDTASGSLLYSLMGATIVVLYVATFVIAIRFLREPSADRVMGTAVRLGLAVSLLGMAVGFVMVALSAHAVGVPDGGPGLPLVGWSTTGGDLRIAHFVGMHALQVLPLLAAALLSVPVLGRGLDETGRAHVVVTVAVAYAALVVLLTWQALRAQPLLRPDLLTGAVLAAVVLAAATALTRVAQRAGRRRDEATTTASGVLDAHRN